MRNAIIYDEFLLDYGIEGQSFTYELQDSSITSDVLGGEEYENSLGLYKNDFTPKVSAGAVKTYNFITAGKKLTDLKKTGYGLFYQKSAYVAAYAQSGQTVYVVWADSQFTLAIDLPNAETTIYDMQGNIIEENVPGGVKRIGASQSPIYIVSDSDPVTVEQNFIQRMITFFKVLFRVLVYGFVGW